MSLQDKIKAQEEEAKNAGYASSGSGEWFKFSEGDNRFRVLTEPEMMFEKFKTGICYIDCGYEGNAKFMVFLLDRKDGKIKLAKLPYSIGTAIAGYEADEDWSFEGYPMPFDINVNAINAGTKEVEYTVIPSPKKESLADQIKDELDKKTPVPEIIKTMKEKQKQKHIEDGTWQAEQDRRAKLKAEIEEARFGGSSIDYPEDDGEMPFPMDGE